MELFASLQQRALQAVDAAKELASTVGTDAIDTAQTVAATFTSDARDMARDAKQKVGVQPAGGQQATENCNARIADDLVAYVRTLTYASFQDGSQASPSASEGGGEASSSPLEPWQVAHCTAVLQQCPELENLRFVLCPKRMSEEQFWHKYFDLVAHIPSIGPGSPQRTPHTAPSHRSVQTSRSGTSAWEDLGASPVPPTGTSPLHSKGPQGDAELDDYLKGMLDDGDLPAAVSGDEEADDLEDYLNELEAGDGEGGEGVGDDVSKYLEDLGLADDAVDDQESPVGGLKAA